MEEQNENEARAPKQFRVIGVQEENNLPSERS